MRRDFFATYLNTDSYLVNTIESPPQQTQEEIRRIISLSRLPLAKRK